MLVGRFVLTRLLLALLPLCDAFSGLVVVVVAVVVVAAVVFVIVLSLFCFLRLGGEHSCRSTHAPTVVLVGSASSACSRTGNLNKTIKLVRRKFQLCFDIVLPKCPLRTIKSMGSIY